MYTYCRIQFIDDESEMDVIIKGNDSVEENEADDEKIFFYGLTEKDLRKACETGEVLEGEWKVLSVDGVYNKLI